jgi:hypothetical protein
MSHQASAAQREIASPIVDLRQYTLFPGARDAFVELFDREFVETQEAAGVRIIGQFCDLGDPNRYVWMRGFPDMPSRQKALTAFYMEGEAWRRHREAANAMMIDSSDAALLRPARLDTGFLLPPVWARPELGADAPRGIVVATLYQLVPAMAHAFPAFFDAVIGPRLTDAGAQLLGRFVTEHSPNNFERLPLRNGEDLFIAFASFPDLSAYEAHMTRLGQCPGWSDIAAAILPFLIGRPQTLRLAPTSRSLLRH